MFIVTPSSEDTWRVFVPSSFNKNVHHHLKNHSVNGGHDDVKWFNHVECKGYEFSSISQASDVIRGCALLLT